MEGFVTFVTVRKGQKQFGRDQVRKLRQDTFEKLFSKSASLGGKNGESFVIILSDEQTSAVEAGQKIAVEELGVFSSVSSAKTAVENTTLKTELDQKDEENKKLQETIEALKAEIEAQPKSKSTKTDK